MAKFNERIVAVFALVFAVAGFVTLNAGTVTWKGGASGDWAGEDVWDPQAPAAGDDVVIENTSSTTGFAAKTSWNRK